MTSAYPAGRVWRALMMRAAALSVLAASLAACQTTRDTTASIPAPPVDYRLRHPIAIQERDRTMIVLVGNARGGLTPVQRADVTAFAVAWKRETTGGIVVELPAHTPNARAAADTLPEIRSILVAVGVPAEGVRVENYQPSDPGRFAPIKISYPRMQADAGPCGQWPDDLGPSYDRAYLENRPYYNFGCAAQRNLAAVVDNPADLVQPRGEAPSHAGRRSIVLDKYRKGDSTATIDPNANQGKISDVGK